MRREAPSKEVALLSPSLLWLRFPPASSPASPSHRLFFPSFLLLTTFRPYPGRMPEAASVPSSVRADTETQMNETLPSGASCPGRRDALQDRPTQAQIIIKGTVCMVVEIARTL